jgi:hypothetical protein
MLSPESPVGPLGTAANRGSKQWPLSPGIPTPAFGLTAGSAVERPSAFEVIGYAHTDLPGSEEQSGLDQKRGLVVQEVLPPM